MTSLGRQLVTFFGGLGKGGDIVHRCGPFEILLTPGHLLQKYQRKHGRYDRFLPHLATALPSGSTVIDVGANCGDTLAAMAAVRDDLRYLCIEPDEAFFSYLQANLERMRAVRPALKAQAVRAMVGLQVTSAALVGEGGSKHALPQAGGQRTTTADALVAAHPGPAVSLLKTDVDGFDYDVIDSALGTVERDQPLIYFECQPLNADQQRGFEATVAALEARGYVRWVIFDNFGEPMLCHAQASQIAELMGYLSRQQLPGGTRTLYYTDILCATAKDFELVDKSVAAYRDFGGDSDGR